MYRLNVFGRVSIDGADGPVTGRAVQRHRLALLCVLAASRSPSVSRDKHVTYLWPESDSKRARRALADSIYRLNGALGGNAVLGAADQLRLNGSIIESDVAIFRSSIARNAWEEAVQMYAGPFMDGFFLPNSLELERWVEVTRERLESELSRALESLADERHARGDAAGTIDAWRQRAALDRYDSRVALRLAEALARGGNRAAALRHAHAHIRLVEEEYGARPDPEIIAFAGTLTGSTEPRR
jgi:DNA-binding SARP family transcriptional activator